MSAILSTRQIELIDAYWRACNYLALGMIYLRDNPLLREPLKADHIKNRLLGHFGSDPGQSFVWVHLNRLIKEYDLDVLYISGPGHGAPAVFANAYLEGTYSEVYSDRSQDEEGLDIFQTLFLSWRNRQSLHARNPGRFMKAASSDTACRTRSALPSTIPICL